jgi:hypothetical protein
VDDADEAVAEADGERVGIVAPPPQATTSTENRTNTARITTSYDRL